MLPLNAVEPQPCDQLGPILHGQILSNIAAPKDPANLWQTVSGAVALTPQDAAAGAIAESLERLAAAQTAVPLQSRAQITDAMRLDESAFALFSDAQRAQSGFPWPLHTAADDLYAPVFHLTHNQVRWVPQELIGLGPRTGQARMPSTSSGLAAWRDQAGGPWLAVLRATQELLERDALTCTWLNGLGGRSLTLPDAWTAYAAARGGELQAFDLTQAWNPHKVVAVAGGLPYEGRARFVLGIACRSSLGAALHKALLEWAQSLTFAAHLAKHDEDLPHQAAELRRFDQHAVFYTLRPDLWHQTALIAHASPDDPGHAANDASPQAVQAHPDTTQAHQAQEQLHAVQAALAQQDIDLYYRELTTADVARTGLRVMRVLSPQLSGLHADERAPFLGGRCADIQWRYPGCTRHTPFPNPLPHPLG